MAPKDNNKNSNAKGKIDLSKAQFNEESSVSEDEDILLNEEELLGTAPGSSGASQTGAGQPATQTAGAKPVSDASKFHIPIVVKNKYPELIPLILETESMDDEEREYWFQILPIMTDDQIDKFKDILISEKEQLAKLDAEYEQELQKINEKHLLEWQEFEQKQAREELEKKEGEEEEEEAQVEEDLLKKLDEL